MGTVRLAKTRDGKTFVLKGIRKEYVIRHNDHRHVTNERILLSLLSSTLTVRLFGVFQDTQCLYFALEFCPGGDLYHRLYERKDAHLDPHTDSTVAPGRSPFSSDEAKFYVSEICAALSHVHSLGYVYRDLKPDNVMLDEEGHIKLTDFGFSAPCASDGRLKTLCGTPAYLSPEQLNGKLTDGYVGGPVDWWSLGVVLYECLYARTPFASPGGGGAGEGEKSHYEVYLRILKGHIAFPLLGRTDTHAKDLIQRLCHRSPDQRLCTTEAVQAHHYFTVPWGAVEARRLVPPFVPRLKDAGDHDRYFTKTYSDPGAPDEGYCGSNKPNGGTAGKYSFDGF